MFAKLRVSVYRIKEILHLIQTVVRQAVDGLEFTANEENITVVNGIHGEADRSMLQDRFDEGIALF